MLSMPPALTALLDRYGIVGVFLASITEEIVAPIPSSVVGISAGFLLVPQDAHLLNAAMQIATNVMLPASAGIAIGSLVPYYVARIGGRITVERFGYLFGVKPASLAKAEQWFSKHTYDEILLFAARCIPLIPSVVIGLFCGLVRMPLSEFMLFTFLGSLVRTFILGMIGWWAGRTYVTYADQINQIQAGVIAIIVSFALIAGILWWRARKHRGAKPAAG